MVKQKHEPANNSKESRSLAIATAVGPEPCVVNTYVSEDLPLRKAGRRLDQIMDSAVREKMAGRSYG